MDKILNFIQQKKLASLIIILILTTIAFSNIFSNEFVWDDPDFYQNWPALYSFENIPDLLTGDLPAQHGGVYRPLRSVSQLFIFQLLSDKASNEPNLFGYHLISLLIHLFSVVAVYLLIEILTKKRKLAFFGALLFGLHPIHVEAITYFTTSIDALGAAFFLWSIYFYFKSQAGNKILYITSIILAWLAFFTYEIALVLPAGLILIEAFKQDFNWTGIKEKIKSYIPYFLGFFVWLILRISLEIGIRPLSSTMDTTLFTRLLTVSKAIIKYLYLTFVPFPLNVYHKIDYSWSLAEPKVFLSLLAIISLITAAIFLAKKKKIISFCIFWFFLTLAPVSNIFPTGIIMAEKYAYLASISSCLVLAWLIYYLIKKESQGLKILGLIVFVLIAIFYGSLTYARNFDWKDNETLWLKTLEVRPDYGRVYNNLGFFYYQQENYTEAINYLEKALEKEPNLPLIYLNLGNVYDELGEYEKAITNYEKIIELKDNFAEAYNNLAITYQKVDELDKALENYIKAIETDPSYFLAYSNTGVIYLMKNDYQNAKEYFQKALEINSNFTKARLGLAIIYLNQKEYGLAIKELETILEIEPTNQDAKKTLEHILEITQ